MTRPAPDIAKDFRERADQATDEAVPWAVVTLTADDLREAAAVLEQQHAEIAELRADGSRLAKQALDAQSELKALRDDPYAGRNPWPMSGGET